MTNPEIPRRSLVAAVSAYEARRAAGDSSADAMREALSAAALHHLRVQETPLRKAHHCPTWEDPDGCTPHLRPVVDREALTAAIKKLADKRVVLSSPKHNLWRCATEDEVREITLAVLALLPTEEGASHG